MSPVARAVLAGALAITSAAALLIAVLMLVGYAMSESHARSRLLVPDALVLSVAATAGVIAYRVRPRLR